MDATRAHKVISALADGVHPLTGETFAPDSPYQQTEIVRALYCALGVLARVDGAVVPTARADATPASRTNATSAKPAAHTNDHATNRQTAPSQSQSKGNAGKPWTAEEERELLARFDEGELPGDLAKRHGRSIAGIEARLERLGRLRPDQRTTTSRFPMSAQRKGASAP